MSLFEKTFDFKKCTRALSRQANTSETGMNNSSDTITVNDLIPCLCQAYIQILRQNTIDLRALDFSKIGYNDIDKLEHMLDNSHANRLFRICEVFKNFAPATVGERVFI